MAAVDVGADMNLMVLDSLYYDCLFLTQRRRSKMEEAVLLKKDVEAKSIKASLREPGGGAMMKDREIK